MYSRQIFYLFNPTDFPLVCQSNVFGAALFISLIILVIAMMGEIAAMTR